MKNVGAKVSQLAHLFQSRSKEDLTAISPAGSAQKSTSRNDLTETHEVCLLLVSPFFGSAIHIQSRFVCLPIQPGPPTVVRTESQLARFNSARALFEKGTASSASAGLRGTSGSGRSSRVNSEGSRNSFYSSRSPSPSAGSIQQLTSPSPLQRHQSVPTPGRRSSSPQQVILVPDPPPPAMPPPPVKVLPVPAAPTNKPELPAKTDKARISSKELIEKQKNWIQHFKGTAGPANNKPALQPKPSANPAELNRINSANGRPKPLETPKDWAKERSGVLAGWMASPSIQPNDKDGRNFLTARQRFENKKEPTSPPAVPPPKPALPVPPPVQQKVEDEVEKLPAVKNGVEEALEETPEETPAPAEVSQVESVIEEALERMDQTPPASFVLNSSLPEIEEVFYDNSVTSARFDEWQLRTPTQLDDSPVLKSSATPLDFDALLSDGDETKQLEPDDEELFRAVSAELSETELSPISSPPPEFRKEPKVMEPMENGEEEHPHQQQLVIRLDGFADLLESSDETAVDSLEPELVQINSGELPAAVHPSGDDRPTVNLGEAIQRVDEDEDLPRPNFRVEAARVEAEEDGLTMTSEEADSLLSAR